MTSTVWEHGHRQQVRVVDERLSFEGEGRPLYAGAVHYWRIARDRWEVVLDEVKELGFTAVSIYIPWEVHEVARGEFRFDAERDVDAFISMVEQRGLDVVVRPGPQINAELTWFGYPLRVLRDAELHALNSHGTLAVLAQVPRPIPALSYASEKFFEEVALWYDAICPILAKHAYPRGRLRAAQVDNEMAYFFHVNAYAADYHPASIAQYRQFLASTYDTIAELNEAYGRSYASFEEVEPPRRFEGRTMRDVPYYVDWAAYREQYLVTAVARLADMLRERGLADIALFHNYPHPLGPGGAASGFTAPFNLPALEEQLDFVGFDLYSRKELYHHIKTILSYVVGTSRFPYVPELIAGVWPWYLHPGDLADEEFVTKAALMQGIKGFSRYMLVERDRWMGSPVRRDGRLRPDHAAMFKRANELLMSVGANGLRRQADVLLLANRDYDRLEAASVLVSFPGDFLETPSGFSEYPSYMTVSESALGFDRPVQIEKTAWFTEASSGLEDGGFAYLISDTALPLERWSRFKAVVVSSFVFMDHALQAQLRDFACAGGTVVLGPDLPVLDMRGRADTTLADAVGDQAEDLGRGATCFEVGAGRVVRLARAESVRVAVVEALEGVSGEGLARAIRSDPRVDVSVHLPSGADDGRRVVYVANPTAEPVRTRVRLIPPVAFTKELWDGRSVVASEELDEELPSYSVRVYEGRSGGFPARDDGGR